MIEHVTLDLLQLAMEIKQAEHKASAANVASANIPGASKSTVDFSSLLQTLDNNDKQTQSVLVDSIRQDWKNQVDNHTSRIEGAAIKLDEESAKLLLTSGRYRLMAESVSRQLGLMNIAVSGGKR